LFNYFPNNYAWSSTVVMGLMSGGQFGEMHRWLEPLRDVEPDMQAWDKAWVDLVVSIGSPQPATTARRTTFCALAWSTVNASVP
jgi:hypothetical protein